MSNLANARKIADEMEDADGEVSVSRIDRLERKNKKLKFLLAQYIAKFDDNKLSNEEVKSWLDTVWIPSVREVTK